MIQGSRFLHREFQNFLGTGGEGGIPNATDVQDWRWVEAEFGVTPKESFTYNSEKWAKIDEWVNLGLQSLGRSERVHHEPYNNAVVGVYWS